MYMPALNTSGVAHYLKKGSNNVRTIDSEGLDDSSNAHNKRTEHDRPSSTKPIIDDWDKW